MRSAGLVAMIVVITAAFGAGALLQKSGALQMSKTQYLKLKEPLLLNAEGELKYFHMLPAGTALYKDYSFPEGHTRYIVYVNIKGSFEAETVESDKRNLIDPIWAYTVKKDEVQQLMAETPISKDDLVRILKARKMTREDLAQIVREWTD